MRIIFYVFAFIISFIFFFLYSFPVREVIGGSLSKKGINFEKINGNLLSIQIKGISYGKFILPDLKVENKFLKINLIVNNKHKIEVYPLKKYIKLNIKNLKFENFLREKIIKGNLSVKGKIFLKNNYLLSRIKGETFINRFNMLPVIKDVKLNFKTDVANLQNKIYATIHSQFLSGKFEGKLKLPLYIKNGELKGQFNGKIYGSIVNKNIHIKLKNLIQGKVW